jgi:hypothetical protein
VEAHFAAGSSGGGGRTTTTSIPATGSAVEAAASAAVAAAAAAAAAAAGTSALGEVVGGEGGGMGPAGAAALARLRGSGRPCATIPGTGWRGAWACQQRCFPSRCGWEEEEAGVGVAVAVAALHRLCPQTPTRQPTRRQRTTEATRTTRTRGRTAGKTGTKTEEGLQRRKRDDRGRAGKAVCTTFPNILSLTDQNQAPAKHVRPTSKSTAGERPTRGSGMRAWRRWGGVREGRGPLPPNSQSAAHTTRTGPRARPRAVAQAHYIILLFVALMRIRQGMLFSLPQTGARGGAWEALESALTCPNARIFSLLGSHGSLIVVQPAQRRGRGE